MLAWYFENDSIPGAVQQTYKPTKSGNYMVEIANEKGCRNTSASYKFDINDVDENFANNFNHATVPNPFNGITTISFILKSSGIASVSIIDLLGNDVDNVCSSIFFNAGQNYLEFDSGNILAGIYLCLVECEGIKEVRKMGIMK